MADLWSHQFCLACDKQVEADSAAYCSEACRLTELERTSTPSSQASSPGLTPASYPWSTQAKEQQQRQQQQSSKFFLSPAYDFANAQPYGTTPVQQSLFGTYSMSAQAKPAGPTGSLTPSSSHTSLCSIQSTSTNGEPSQLSDRARQELRAYAVSFEHVRTQRRRSY
ncbi:hypothetical protein ACRE_044280 [Hapsidospora chrysogenum ATCC 11550]|uniref:Uncharacterized protein n=1 Tax=Hapsidospora chrysogenum (strain ATCC 11550 / CBS 779.69 / DSM 880 / IAM 14645 / JCM 23072 / IMI 49137) TaxID=857340 RepID=A0A086T611_HAPC1|nr:hypothetical protein ACRE_044280 [Hapsidospora chrysogenum ATCC 11550]